MRVLLDSNVWRYLVDASAIPALRQAAARSKHSIVMAPAVLFEAAHAKDETIRNALLDAMTDRCWKRLMPEAYSEAEEFKCEVRRLRPNWLRSRPDLNRFKRIRQDWCRSRGGLWDRIKPDALLLQELEVQTGFLQRARIQSRELRENALSMPPKWQTLPLLSYFGSLPQPRLGWDGEPFEPWRFDGYNVLLVALGTYGHPTFDWIEGEIDIDGLVNSPESHLHFWLREVDILRMPRHWLRWAFEFLQRQYRVTEGTPVDCQLGAYLVDVDLMLSADKTLVRIAEKCRHDAPFAVAESRVVPGGSSAVEAVLDTLLRTGDSQFSGCSQ